MPTKGTRRYIDVLGDLITSYNNTFHRTIKKKPIDVTRENSKQVFYNMYKVRSRREFKRNFKNNLIVGDNVRKQYKLNQFDKGYYPNWSDNIYQVTKVVKCPINSLYKLKNEGGDSLSKRYYKEEIQKVTPGAFRIEKILARRKRKGKLEYLIKWLNHPESYNSWEPAENIKNL
ncbi:hypothetical protein B4U79_08757 [Dinothrombium tinctorium]|uniref:Chromo domain-containing protein n=2 Tax=Dinothrombium tinctorium TaxID=1965070 RepID=A0A443Q752_9ACAR|nr:hypothetical protein B4U79_08757 [Dinothrombium tinctorium]